MNKEEFIGKLQLCYFGDRNAFEEIVSVYDNLQDRINKAIEYIKGYCTEFGEIVHYGDAIDPTELLEILNGRTEILEILKGSNNE